MKADWIDVWEIVELGKLGQNLVCPTDILTLVAVGRGQHERLGVAGVEIAGDEKVATAKTNWGLQHFSRDTVETGPLRQFSLFLGHDLARLTDLSHFEFVSRYVGIELAIADRDVVPVLLSHGRESCIHVSPEAVEDWFVDWFHGQTLRNSVKTVQHYFQLFSLIHSLTDS